MFQIALHEPKIAPNTGNIIRLAANTGSQLHLIEPLGFSLEDKQLRRAGLDYHNLSRVTRHSDYKSFLAFIENRRIFSCSTKGKHYYHEVDYQEGDVLLFGSETTGLPVDILDSLESEHLIRIPMQSNNRSLNLANAVAVICYEAWRQHSFIGGK